MLKVGITGGIGSGKTTVCQVFETLGIPVLYADDLAKKLMNTDPKLRTKIIDIFGVQAYESDTLNRAFIASVVFENKEKLTTLNAAVHPAVISYGNSWMQQQKSRYTIKEAALFFETGSNNEMDLMIGVFAPLSLRIQRSMQRDNVSAEKVAARVAQQMDDEQKMKLCDFVVINDDTHSVIEQVLEIHKDILALKK